MIPKVQKTDFSMPALGFGTYKLTGPEGMQVVQTALSLGYRHIDTAQVYGNEKEVGHAIKNSSIDRNELFITTKIRPENFENLSMAIETSLKDLQVDQVDLLLLHWPAKDFEITKKGVVALNEILAKKLSRYVGVSNFNIRLLEMAQELAPIVCNQVEYHPFLDQQKLLKYMREKGLLLTAYSPLAQGRVPGNAELHKIGEKYNKTESQVALRWLLQQDGVAAVPKASSEKHQKTNLDIFDFELDKADMDAVFALNTDHHLVNASTAPEWD